MHLGWEAGCQSPKPRSSLDVRVSLSFLISKIGKKGLMTELRERMVIEKVWGDFPGGRAATILQSRQSRFDPCSGT